MGFELRDYQQRLADLGDAAMLAGQRPCLEAPTGAGKTVILAELARRALARGEQVWVICHREEILDQIVASLQRHLGERQPIARVVAGSRPRLDRQLVVGMVPTMVRRLEQLAHHQGGTLLADECHHLPSRSWQQVVEALAPRRLAGLSATPVRPDGSGLGDSGAFDVLHRGPAPAELMAQGKLCRYRMFAARHRMDSQGLHRRGGEFIAAEMEQRVVQINGHIVGDWLELNPERLQTITVAVSVEHAHEVAAMYRAAGVAAEAVDGATPKVERRAVFDRFRRGQTTVLVACAVIDEGLDVPEATVLQLLRFTASLRLWKQLLGRVLRPAPGKREALILDHTDNWRRLPPPDAEIDWALTSERQEPAQRLRMVVDDDTGEVRSAAPLEPVEVEETGARLEELTPAVLAAAHPIVARRLLNERCRLQIEQGATQLRQWLNYLDVLEDETLRALGPALGMPAGWAEGQIMIRLLLSPGQRLAATKRLQHAGVL